MMTYMERMIGRVDGAQLLAFVGGRATLLLLVTAAMLLALRRGSASARHAVLALAAAALLALPALRLAVPRWEVALLRAEVVQRPQATPLRVARDHETRAVLPPALSPGRVDVPLPRASASGRAPSAAVAAAPVSRETPVRRWPPSLWLLLAWAVGAAAALAQLAAAHLFMMRKTRRAAAVVDQGWLRQLAEASADLGVARPVRLMVDPSVAVPVAFGYRRSTIVLPPSAEAWPESRRRAVLLHELAHVGRHDCLSQGVALLARGLYWPNPLVWWLAARLRAEAERACDDAVLSVGRVAPPEYATHLLEAARDLKRAPRPLAVVAVVERSPLEERLMALLDPTVRRGAIGRVGLATVASMTLAVAGSIAGLQPVARAFAAEPLPSAHAEKKVAPTRPAATTAPAPAVSKAGAPAPAAAKAESGATVEAAPAAPVATPRPAPAPAASASERVAVSPDPAAQDSPPLAAAPAAGVTVAAPAAPVAPAPATSVPIIRISTDVVQIDAVVTDKSGRQVTDLRPEDFEVYENGQRKIITHLAYVRTGQGLVSGAVDAIDPSGETKEPRTMVFVVDDLGLSPPAATWARQMLLDFAEHGVAENDRVALVRTGERRGRAVSLVWGASETQRAAEALRYNPWNRTTLTSASSDDGRSADGISLFYQLAYDSLGSLKATVEALRALPGRKAVIFVSEGLGALLGNDRNGLLRDYSRGRLDPLYDDSGVRAALNSLTDLANRASVVIYAIDPAGLTTDGLSADVRTPGQVPGAANPQDFSASTLLAPQLVDRNRMSRISRQDSLLEIAGQTGGLAILDTNDLHAGLDRILEDHSGYYLLAYEPDPGTFEGKATFHELKVRVKRHGLKVRSRQGFYSVSDDVVAKALPAAHTE